MIDGFSIRVDAGLEKLQCIKEKCSLKKGVYKYKGLIFLFNENSCHIRGSIHKYKNHGDNNDDDFFFSDYLQTLEDLQYEFGIKPESTTFCSLEFGVNLQLTDYTPIMVMESIIAYTKGNPVINTPNREMVTFVFEEYNLKIYIKTNSILRVEIKIKKMRALSKIKKDVTYLSSMTDFANIQVWTHFGKMLQEELNNVLIVYIDEQNINQMSYQDERIYLRGINPKVWIYKKWRNRKEKQRFIEAFNRILSFKMKKIIVHSIGCKIKQLINRNVTDSPFI